MILCYFGIGGSYMDQLYMENDYDSIEIYSRTNSIGLPIEYNRNDLILNTNVNELFTNGWFQTNEYTKLVYISSYMNNITVESDGNIILNVSTLLSINRMHNIFLNRNHLFR